MSKCIPAEKVQIQFIWKDSLPVWIDFGYELRRTGLRQVVELGSRVGQTAIALSKLGLDVITIDKSLNNIDIIEGRAFAEGCDITALLQTNNTLPFGNESIQSFVTATALHHSLPEETSELVGEIYRTLIPGGRVAVAVVSVDDYRYGTGIEVAKNTFQNTSGPEMNALHQFYDEDSLLSLFHLFTPECNPFIIPSMYTMNTPEGKRQGKLLCCRFLKGLDLNLKPETHIPHSLSEGLANANRSLEILFAYPTTAKGTCFSNACLNFLNNLTPETLGDVYCQCVIIGNVPIETIDTLSSLQKRFEGNIYFSLAYSELPNEAQIMNSVIMDGIVGFACPHSESSYQPIELKEATTVFVNFLRNQINTCWKKSTILLDNGTIRTDRLIEYASIIDDQTITTSKVKPMNFDVKRKNHIKVGVTQMDLRGILSTGENHLLTPDITKLPNLTRLVIAKSANMNLNLLLFPELAGDESLNEILQTAATEYNMVIVGGSYYNQDRINCCPVAIPGRSTPYLVEKTNPSPYERSPLEGFGIVEGSQVFVFKNTVAGDIGVAICNDYLNDQLMEEIFDYGIDFLCVVSLNGDSPRFFTKMNSKCKNDQNGIYILYSNSKFTYKSIYADGRSSLFGFMDRIYHDKLERDCSDLECQLSSFTAEESEGLLVADFNIDEKRPRYLSPDSKPNVSGINKIVFESDQFHTK